MFSLDKPKNLEATPKTMNGNASNVDKMVALKGSCRSRLSTMSLLLDEPENILRLI